MSSRETTNNGTMKQWWVIPGPKGGELELRDVPVPSPGPGEVLVRNYSAGVNRGELFALAAVRADNPRARETPSGIEFAGVVAALGPDADDLRWRVGDRVMGRGRACHAEFVCTDAAACMAIPAHLSLEQAGAIPNVFVTAHDAIVCAARVQPRETVLISAGSSGVGTAAIQIARHLGAARIIATTRSRSKRAALQALGVTDVVCTVDSGWSDQLGGTQPAVDVVIDQVGGSLFPDLLRTLRTEGRYVTVGRNDGASATVDLDRIALYRLSLIGVTFRTRTPAEALACSTRFADDLLSAFSESGLRPVLDRSFALAELPDAHAYMLANQQFGKVVLTL